MGRRITQIAIAILIAAAFFLPPLIVEACGPDLSAPTFTSYNAPNAPFDAYARGNLDLLEPGYFHIYFYAAYRNLTGKGPSEEEITVMKNPYAVPANRTTPQQGAANQPPPNWIDRWQAARQQVLDNSRRSISATTRRREYSAPSRSKVHTSNTTIASPALSKTPSTFSTAALCGSERKTPT